MPIILSLLLSNQDTTDADGVATAYLQLGNEVPDNIVTVSVPLALNSPMIFTARGHKSYWIVLSNIIFLFILTCLLALVVQLALRRRKQLEKASPSFTKETKQQKKMRKQEENAQLLSYVASVHDHPVRTPSP